MTPGDIRRIDSFTCITNAGPRESLRLTFARATACNLRNAVFACRNHYFMQGLIQYIVGEPSNRVDKKFLVTNQEATLAIARA